MSKAGNKNNEATPKFLTPTINIIDCDGEQSFETISFGRFSDIPSEFIIQSRIKYGNRWSLCKGIWYDYSRKTTIHGFRYIFSLHRPFYERLFWVFFTLISLYFALSSIWATFLKWQDSPVILGFDETLVPVYKIPFPTITICPEIKMDQEIFNFTNMTKLLWNEFQENNKFQNLDDFTQEDFDNLAATLHICEEEVVKQFAQFVPLDTNPDISQTLVNLSIPKNQTGPFCKWNSRFYFCLNIFSFVATDEGICYQFNGLEAKDLYRDLSYVNYYDPDVPDFQKYFDQYLPPLNNITGYWSLEDGFVEQGANAYPQRTVFSSARNGLYALLQGFKHNLEYACRSFKQGYRVFINSPESVPLTSGNYILVPHKNEVMISVLPQYIIGHKNLQGFSPEKRQCFFNNERYLRYFKHYSEANCQTECLVNYTISRCGCAKFWMPKPPEIPVCAVKDISCYIKAQQEFGILLQKETMQKANNPGIKPTCDCMPSCTSLEYNVEISSAFYDFHASLAAWREVYEHPDALGSRLTIYFKERQFTAIKRTVLYGTSTLVANIGGVFALFMGISILSIIELCYFFTVRLCDNLRMRHQTRQKMMKNNKNV